MKLVGIIPLYSLTSSYISYIPITLLSPKFNTFTAGTTFEDLPQDWVCPDRGVGKEEFEAIED